MLSDDHKIIRSLFSCFLNCIVRTWCLTLKRFYSVYWSSQILFSAKMVMGMFISVSSLGGPPRRAIVVEEGAAAGCGGKTWAAFAARKEQWGHGRGDCRGGLLQTAESRAATSSGFLILFLKSLSINNLLPNQFFHFIPFYLFLSS